MRELVITPPEWKYDEVSTSITLAGRTLGDQIHSVKFVASEDVGWEVDFLLPLALLPAMVTDSRLKLPGQISYRLFSAVPTLQNVFCLWDEEFDIYPPKRILVDAEIQSRDGEHASGVACLFSGGVDSFYTLLKNLDEITHLIFVHGFDISLTNYSLRAQASHAAREVARELGKSLIEVTTDLRSLSDPLVQWRQYQGAALASVGLLFQHLFHKVLIPAAYSYADLRPWGSHPLLDPLWSTELTNFEHDGCEATRVDKVAYISRHEVAMKWLRVCWLLPNYDYNCGSCGKCLTTMINLQAAGALERCRTLPHTIDLNAIPKIDRSDKDGMAFAQQNIRALERSGSDPELAGALKKATQPPTLYPRRRYMVANVLLDKTRKVPGARKVVRQERSIRLREVFDPEEWNAAVGALGGSIAQSWEWGLAHQTEGWKPLRLLDEEGRGAVQLLFMEQRGGFSSIAYAPYGPLAANPSDLPKITAFAAHRARECGAHLLRVEPRWGAGLGREAFGTGRYVETKNRRLPGSTIIVDIPKDPEGHLKALPEDTRSGIFRSLDQGVEVEPLSRHGLERSGGIEEFLDLLEDTSRRQGFSFAPRDHYWTLIFYFRAHLVVARHEGRLVAGALTAVFGDEAYYLYGAFTTEEENLRALDLVQWEAMDLARKAGCSRYDMWGMPYRPYPGYWAWGFDPSKTRFGGTPVEYTGARLRILSHLQLWEQSAINLGLERYEALKRIKKGVS